MLSPTLPACPPLRPHALHPLAKRINPLLVRAAGTHVLRDKHPVCPQLRHLGQQVPQRLLVQIREPSAAPHPLRAAVLERQVEHASGLEVVGILAQQAWQIFQRDMQQRRACPDAVEAALRLVFVKERAGHRLADHAACDVAHLLRAVHGNHLEPAALERPRVPARAASQVHHARPLGQVAGKLVLKLAELDL